MDIEELGKAPIPGDTPQGSDPKYETAYGVLQDEIRKLSSLSAGSIEWSTVVRSATEVLGTIAKDIPAATYLSIGLAHTEGLTGWARGTQVCADILAGYWETAFPPLARLRARSNSMDWWKERTLALLESWTSNAPCPWEDFAGAQAALEALDAQMGERFPDQPPLYDVREALKRVPAQSPPAEPTAPTDSPAPSAETPSAAPAPSASSAPAQHSTAINMPQSVQGLTEVYGLLHQLAGETLNFLCTPEPAPDPLAWKIFYASLLGKMTALPPAEGGTTAIPAPDPTSLATCRSHLEAGRVLQGVSAAVAFAPACPLWLDVQRCVAEGLTAAGPEYAGALSVVRHECAGLLERLPNLDQLAFADGTPFADPATRSWLGSLNSGEGGDGQSAEETLAGAAVAKAGTLSAQGNPAGALEALEEAACAVHGKDNAVCLRLRVQQLRLLCRENRLALAGNLADDISSAVDQYGLELWDAALALEVRQAVYTAFAALEGTEGPRAREALRRVTRLSPAAALRLEQ